MPTANRRRFVPRAIGCFLRQDYPNKELVILDDGADSVADLIPDDPQIRYLRLTGKRTLGKKRNECVEASRGDLIMHWDDDDWHAPRRIRSQVEALLKADAEICSVTQMLYYEMATGAVWLYHYPTGKTPKWVAGNAMLYTRAFWKRSPFPDIQVASDTRFIFNHKLDRAVVLDDLGLYVAMIHASNVSPKTRRGAYWSRWSGDLRAVMGDDLDFYAPQPPQITIREVQPETAPMQTDNCVTVSIPYYSAQGYIVKAVESILAQTHRELQLIVVNDGDPNPPWQALDSIRDPRLIRFDLSANRGRYFADAVVLNAVDTPYFAVQDADDWSEPRRIETLLRRLRETHADAAVAAYSHVDAQGKRLVKQSASAALPLAQQLKHHLSHYCLFRADALRAIGGYYGGFRLGYDTLLMNLLLMTGRVTDSSEPLYVRNYRPDSLVNAASTGLRSPARLESTRKLRALYAAAYAHYTEYLSGKRSADSLVEAIRTLVESYVTPEDQAALEAESGRLRALLAQPNAEVAPPETPPIQIVTPRDPETRLKHLLDSPQLRWESWAISKTVAVELFHRLHTTRPKRILECGSGISSVFLAQYAADHGALLTILEHERTYFEATRRLLDAFGLLKHADLRLTPLAEQPGDGHRFWYADDLGGAFDFILIDGPPEKVGRAGALFALQGHLAPGWEAWLHDGHRAHEQACVKLWQQHFTFSASLHDLDEKGVWVLSDAPVAAPLKLPTAKIGISLLTGQRLDLFRQTVQSLQAHAGDLLARSRVVLMINGKDAETEAFAATLPFVSRVIVHRGAILPIGTATTKLMQTLAQEADYLLHLEDDWCISSLDGGWLERAAAILVAYPEIGQVRLRHRGERVLPYHMVTHKPIRWLRRDDFLYAEQAHFTFNPALIRARDVGRIYPCATEHEAQRHYLASGMASAQLSPGVFRHTGARNSLRRKLHQQ